MLELLAPTSQPGAPRHHPGRSKVLRTLSGAAAPSLAAPRAPQTGRSELAPGRPRTAPFVPGKMGGKTKAFRLCKDLVPQFMNAFSW